MASGPTRERVEIDDHVFFVRRFPALKALPILGNLQTLLMRPLAKLDATGLLDSASGIDTNMAAIMAAVTELSTTLDGATLLHWQSVLINPNFVSYVVDEPSMPEQLTDKLIDERLDVSVVLELMVRVALINFKAVFTKASSRVGEALRSKGPSRLESSAIV